MRPGPLFLAAAALAGGELLALSRQGIRVPPAIPGLMAVLAAVFAALLVVRSYPSGRPTARERASTTAAALSLVACVLAGLALGGAAGRASQASCTARLASGDSVRVSGWPDSPLRAESPLRAPTAPLASSGPGAATARPPTLRVRLTGVELLAAAGRCRLPRLSVVLARTPTGVDSLPGRLTARGVWRRYDDVDPPRPRSPDRYGYVRARLIAAGPSAHRDATLARRHGWLDALRVAAVERLRRRMPPDVRGVAVAMTLADRTEVSPLWSRRFAESGLAHLLAISGLHVGILAGLCTGLFGLLGATRWRHLLAALTIAAYVVAIGAPPAAMRAGLIFVLYAIARQRGSPRQFTDMVGAAAIVALAARPLVLLEPGFQLSFAGFMGVAVGNRCAKRWIAAARRRVSSPGASLSAAFRLGVIGTAAFLATAPFAALHFQRSAPIAIASSWIGTPLVALALPALIGTLVLPAPLAALSASSAAALLRLLVALVTWFAGLPFGHGSTAPPRLDHWIAFAFLAAAAAAFAAGRRPGRALWPALIALAMWLAGPAFVLAPLRGRTLVCSVAVGQGDAAVIRTRRGNWLVFDAGPIGGSRGPLLRFLRRHATDGVELLSLSHPHYDHMAGVPALLEAFRVRRVLDAGNPLPSERYADFLDATSAEGAEWLQGLAGAELQVDEVQIQVLGPALAPGSTAGPAYADANEASLSLRIAIGRFIYLNTGDAPDDQETEMLERWPADRLRADVLKLGHHGSRTSSSLDWLRTVSPRIALISAGVRNRYGHPHPETLARLDSAGIEQVWRTDEMGTLCIEIYRNGEWRIRSPA